MREQIIEHLVARGLATGDQAEQARALIALGGGGLVSLLCEAGFPEGDVLAAASDVTRLPRAPAELLRKPRAHEVAGLDLAPFRAAGAAPFAVHKGTLCVAFKDPEVALSDAARRLPAHRAFLAASAHVEGALAVLSGAPAPAAPRPAPPRPASSSTSSNTPSQPIAAILRSPADDDGWNESGVYRVSAREHVEAREEVPAARRATPAPFAATEVAPLPMDANDLGLVSVDAAKTVAVPALASAPSVDEARTVGVAVPEALVRVSSLEGPAAEAPADDAPTVVAPMLSSPRAPSPAPFSTPPSPRAPSPSPFDDLPATVADESRAEALPDASAQPPKPAQPELTVPAPAPIHAVPARASVAAAETGEGPRASREPIDVTREKLVSGIERYETVKVLGRGGMATVYLARDTATGRDVALKIMEPHLAEDPTFIERFRREMKTSASLAHENIVGVLDCAESGGNLYMAAEYVDAGTLKELLASMGGRVPGPVVVEILYQALLGLAHAHDKSLVHRDLKPANLMLTRTGVVKVGDFGIAKSNTDNTITQTGMLFGTPAYMSPEQAFGKELDGRSDLFSVGTVCYELLCGKNPYNHENMSTCLILISRASARHILEVCPGVPPLLDEVLTRLMRADRNDRYPTAAAAAAALEPLVTLLRARYGNLLAQALADPGALKAQLAREEAALEVDRASSLLARNPAELTHQAAFRYFRASVLDSGYPPAAEGFARLSAEHQLRFEAAPDEPALKELEQALEKKPDSAALLRRGADLCMAKRNLLGAAVWMKRYLLLQPGDLHMSRQLARILGEDPLAPWRPLPDLENTPATGAQLGAHSPFGAAGMAPFASSQDPFGGLATPIEEASGSGAWLRPPETPAPLAAGEADEHSAPTGVVEPFPGPAGIPGVGADVAGLASDATGRMRALVARHRTRLRAAGIAAAALLVLVFGLRTTFALLDGDEPAAASISAPVADVAAAVATKPQAPPAKDEAPVDDEALARIEAEALAERPEPKQQDWLAARAEQQQARFADGQQKLSRGDVEGALADFNAALILDAGSDLAHDIRLARGKAYLDAGRAEEARSDLERVSGRLPKSDPRHAEAKALLTKLPAPDTTTEREAKPRKPGIEVGTFEASLEGE